MVKADATAVVIGALLALALFGWARIEEPGSAPPPAASSAPSRAVSDVPRIALARIEGAVAPSRAGQRDVFDYAVAPRRAPSASAVPALPPVSLAPAAPSGPVAPVVPPLSVKFIGALDRDGTKVAILMTDHKEILTARAGEVVANRLRIVRIGLESVDVQDVGGGATRRLPLRAN